MSKGFYFVGALLEVFTVFSLLPFLNLNKRRGKLKTEHQMNKKIEICLILMGLSAVTFYFYRLLSGFTMGLADPIRKHIETPQVISSLGAELFNNSIAVLILFFVIILLVFKVEGELDD